MDLGFTTLEGPRLPDTLPISFSWCGREGLVWRIDRLLLSPSTFNTLVKRKEIWSVALLPIQVIITVSAF